MATSRSSSKSNSSSRRSSHGPVSHATRTARAKASQIRESADRATSRARSTGGGLLGSASTALADAGIDLEPIQNALDQLQDTLSQGWSKVQHQMDSAVRQLSSKADELQEQAEEGDSGARKLYAKVVRALQEAADKGNQAASKALAKLGIESE